MDGSDSIFWHKKGGKLSKTYKNFIFFPIESIVFCDQKIYFILKTIGSIPSIFLKINVIDSITVDLSKRLKINGSNSQPWKIHIKI